MQAIVYEYNGAARDVLRVDTLPVPGPKAGEVLVRLAAVGLNPSDGYFRAGAFGPMAYPRIVPGQDGAGVIEQVGDEGLSPRIGTRVWVYNAQWQRPFGTAAEFVVVPAEQAVPLPPSASFEQGATLGVVARTAHVAVFGSGPVEGQTLLIAGGAGATAQAAIRLAKWRGARVLTTVSSSEKADVVRPAGPHAIIDYRAEDVAERVMALTDGRGVDRIVEVNLGANLDLDVRILAEGGEIVAYGSTADFAPKLPIVPLMFKQGRLRVIGSFTLPRAENQRAIDDIDAALAAGVLELPVGRTFGLEHGIDAFEALDEGRVIGKILLDPTAR